VSNGDELRIKSAEMMARALMERHPKISAKLEEIAAIYRQLADDADCNEIVQIESDPK
jgi:hypothetical protein